MSLSMVDVAFQILNENESSMSFLELWKQVCDKMNYPDCGEPTKMSQFFSNISLDNRFAQIDNYWDIRARHRLEDVTIDLTALDIDEDEEDPDYLELEDGAYEEEAEDDE